MSDSFVLRDQTNTADRVFVTTAGHVGIGTGSPGALLTIADGGGLLVGNDTTVPVSGITIENEILGTSVLDSSLFMARWSADDGGPILVFGKSRNAAIGSFTVVQDDDDLGSIQWFADDGTDLGSQAAVILAEIDGTPGANDTPGRIIFGTTPAGAAGGIERMRINSSGEVTIGDTAGGGKLRTYKDDTDTEVGPYNFIAEQDGTGDAIFQWLLTGVRNWYAGIDNSDDDKWKLANTGGVASWATDTVLTFDIAGNMGVGTEDPGNKLDIVTGAATDSAVHIGEAIDEGGYFLSTADNQLVMSGGAEFVASAWTARSTAASLVVCQAGKVEFFGDDSLVDGNTFTPTSRMVITAVGNVVIGSAVAALGQLHVDQASATGAQPVLYLDQADVSEEIFEFNTAIGVGNAIEAIGAKTLTTTHFIKVTLPGALTRYIPAGTIA